MIKDYIILICLQFSYLMCCKFILYFNISYSAQWFTYLLRRIEIKCLNCLKRKKLRRIQIIDIIKLKIVYGRLLFAANSKKQFFCQFEVLLSQILDKKLSDFVNKFFLLYIIHGKSKFIHHFFRIFLIFFGELNSFNVSIII